jgi:hypothetical protein
MKPRTATVLAASGILSALLFSAAFIFMAAAVAIDGAMCGWSSEMEA